MLTAWPSQPFFVSSGRLRMRCSSQMPLTGGPSATGPADTDILSKLQPCPGAHDETQINHHRGVYVPRKLSALTLYEPIVDGPSDEQTAVMSHAQTQALS